MKERAGLLLSSAAHAALIAYALVGLSSARPFEVGPTEALPIEIMSPQEFDAMTKGSKTSKKVDAPAQKVEQLADAESDPADDVPVAKEDVNAPPPPPTAEAPPVPDPKPDVAKAQAAKAEAERAAKAEKAEAAKAEAAKAEVAKAAAAKAEAAKAEAAKAEAAKAEAAKAEAAKVAQEKAEKIAEAAEAERRAKAAEEEKVAKAAQEKAAQEKAAQEKAAQEKAAKEKAEQIAKAEAEKAAKEKAEAEKAAKLAQEKADKEKLEKMAKAEAEKAEKQAKAEAAAKAAKEKADAEKAAKAAERKFDPNKIASLLGNKASSSDSALKDVRDPSRKAASGRQLAPETTAGTSRGTASKLSVSQRVGIDNAVREQISQCWSPPVGASGDNNVVRVRFTLNADGSLSDGPTVDSGGAPRAFADAAARAVRRCSPLKLPADAYDYWRQVDIRFDPKDMMGG